MYLPPLRGTLVEGVLVGTTPSSSTSMLQALRDVAAFPVLAQEQLWFVFVLLMIVSEGLGSRPLGGASSLRETAAMQRLQAGLRSHKMVVRAENSWSCLEAQLQKKQSRGRSGGHSLWPMAQISDKLQCAAQRMVQWQK